MSFIVVDVEADGPVPGLYSMVSFGAVIVEPSLSKTFYGQVKPISEDWLPQEYRERAVSALLVNGIKAQSQSKQRSEKDHDLDEREVEFGPRENV